MSLSDSRTEARAVQIPENVLQTYMDAPVPNDQVELTKTLATALVVLSDRADALLKKVAKLESYAKHMKIVLHASLLAANNDLPAVPSVCLDGFDGFGVSTDPTLNSGDAVMGFPKHLLDITTASTNSPFAFELVGKAKQKMTVRNDADDEDHTDDEGSDSKEEVDWPTWGI